MNIDLTRLVTITDPKEARQWVKLSPDGVGLIQNEIPMHVFRGATLWMVVDKNNQPVTYHCARIGKQKHNIWRPYVNWYTAYTNKQSRRQGYATALAKHVRSLAVEAGCVRLKSLIATKLGLLMHAGLGDQFWGFTSNLEVVVDTPLVASRPGWYNKRPPNAPVEFTETKPWSLDRVLSELGPDRKLRYD